MPNRAHAFNDDEMYLEKLIVNPHHIEFQILADSQGTIVHLGIAIVRSSVAVRR